MIRNECVVGLLAGVVGAFTMNMFARVMNAATGGHEAEGAAPGADRVGRGMQPPQSEGRAEEDAAVRAGSAVYRAATGCEPSREDRLQLGTAAHYAFSAAAGRCYAWAAARLPSITAGYGTAYGTLVWAVADEAVTPALGLSRPPRELGPGVHAYALAGHWVYGATLETVRRKLRSPSTAKRPRRGRRSG